MVKPHKTYPPPLFPCQVANALAQHAGLLPADQGPQEPAPVPPLVEMTEMIHEKMLQTAMVSFGDGTSVFNPHVDLKNRLRWLDD